MKIIWADNDPSWGFSNPFWDVSSQEEPRAEVKLAQQSSREEAEASAQEKGSQKEPKGFG